MSELIVRALMAKHPAAVKIGTELTAVVDILLQHKFTGLPVVDDHNKVVGFVSEQDCLRKLLVSSYHCEGSLVVEEFMHDQPLTVHEEDSAVDVAELMVTQKPKIYPVVDDKGILVGLLTREQVLRALKDSRRGCD
ncbi:CBS domain-containing protein [Alcanivorax sp.]|jgi:CBS domain-containing protein|uniref:CBS domain-containing protein n=1 Tax=Alcanivorax sp. TaxID=1872427 RepID=UPI0019C0124F|nr:CBS domain-containing protein [Alcanivorax sp.]MBD3643857.1 CBS domain-containing protein [Alcanivorax sp.]